MDVPSAEAPALGFFAQPLELCLNVRHVEGFCRRRYSHASRDWCEDACGRSDRGRSRAQPSAGGDIVGSGLGPHRCARLGGPFVPRGPEVVSASGDAEGSVPAAPARCERPSAGAAPEQRSFVAALRRLGYERVRQRGSHVRVTTREGGEHHEVVPLHDPTRAKTLSSILKSVARHHGMGVEELLRKLDLR